MNWTNVLIGMLAGMGITGAFFATIFLAVWLEDTIGEPYAMVLVVMLVFGALGGLIGGSFR